ncbi:protein NIM1-INTERACTING 3-like [Rhodamnia argentea]|uniref:Protein NIM1-INTERACTING 3-like n=1 Tax=Rhodamnia argentea TaxID=178133 RepID=A0A8B8PDH6_9MYRT|nr:protein NIM1-INTERACTING 3-like [Rhodamnia argentea]
MAETETPDRPAGIRGSRKRKATVPPDREREERSVADDRGGGGDGDDDEEKKMEEFFALLRNFREARDRLARSRPYSAAGETGLSDADHHEGRRRKKGSVSAWDPSFQREDFMEEAAPVEKARETLAFGSSGSAGPAEGAENNGEEGELNLRLSL